MKRFPMLLAALAFAAAEAAPTGRAFVSNERGGSLTVIDLATHAVVAEVEVGKQPRGIGLAPDGSELYVALGEENRIAVVDPRSLEVLRKFSPGPDPEAFAVHPNGHIYISMEDSAAAAVFDPKTGRKVAEVPVGLEPEGVAIAPDGSKVIVTSESTNMLHVIGVPGHELLANILVGSRPRSATFSRDGRYAYASTEIGAEVVRVDMGSFRIDKSVRLGEDEAKPKDVLLSRDGQRLYVAGGRSAKVFVLDAATLQPKGAIAVGPRVWGLALSRDGSRLYATNGGNDTVSVIDTARDEVIATVKVGKAPWGIVLDD